MYSSHSDSGMNIPDDVEAKHVLFRRSESFEGQPWFPMSKSGKESYMSENHTSNSTRPRGCCYKFRMQTSIDDIRSYNFWRAIFAELLGTFLLVLYACGATRQDWQKDPLDIVQIALSFGLSVATSVWIIGHISGGHINPAVTCAMLVTRRISLIRAILYIIAQCVGGIAASALLRAVTPSEIVGSLGATTLNTNVTAGMGFGIEFFIVFGLVSTVFAACDGKRTDLGGSFPLTIGFAVSVGHLWAVEYTGSSMNPARSFGPAVIMGIWDNHWVYWVGPIAGGVTAALLYDFVLASNVSVAKARDMLMATDFDDGRYPARKVKVKVLEDDADSGF